MIGDSTAGMRGAMLQAHNKSKSFFMEVADIMAKNPKSKRPVELMERGVENMCKFVTLALQTGDRDGLAAAAELFKLGNHVFGELVESNKQHVT